MTQDSKAARLLAAIDWTKPEIAHLHDEAQPVDALLQYLRQSRRGAYLFEAENRVGLLDFLRAHYGSWRDYDCSAAQAVADRSIEAAKGPRALSDIGLLGQAWLATGDPAWGTAFERFFLETETGDLFTWYSFNGTQPANDLDAWMLLADCPSLTPAGQVAFWDHTVQLADDGWNTHTKNWSQTTLGPEGHNWYLHGIHGLAPYGLLFPEFKDATFLARTAYSVVEEHMRGHYRADGGARETCLGYQGGSLTIMWDLYALGRRNGRSFYAGFEDELLRATRFLLDLMTPDGGISSVGDSGHHPGGLLRLAAQAAAISGDATCKWYAERIRPHSADAANPAGELPLAAFWKVGLAGAANYARIRPQAPGFGSALKGATGYVAMRDSWTADAPYLHMAAADRGPIVTSHGHNDIFALEVHAGGDRFLGEAGCAPYGNSPGRAYDQLTQAHNCLTVDGLEQAEIIDEWRWAQTTIPCIRRWINEPTHDFCHASHEGFYRYQKHPIIHARKVLQLKGDGGYFLVLDWLCSDDTTRDYSIWWHGAVPTTAEGKTLRLRGSARDLIIRPPTDDDVSLSSFSSDGLLAYCQEKKIDPASYPCFRHQASVPAHTFAWLIAPLAPGASGPSIQRLPLTINGEEAPSDHGTALRIESEGQVDTIIVSHRDWDAELETAGLSGWGHLLIQRRGRIDADIRHEVPDGVCGR